MAERWNDSTKVAIDAALEALHAAAGDESVISGLTHDFYRYPARFSPQFARAAIASLSKPGDLVCDIFMGGGTTLVEALAAGRCALGIDINSLACFIAKSKTTPLTPSDVRSVRVWAQSAADVISNVAAGDLEWIELPRIKNLPSGVERFLATALEGAAHLSPKQQRFARAALLRTGQWALDGREFGALKAARIAIALPTIVDQMLDGLGDLVSRCRDAGIDEHEIESQRIILHRSAAGLEVDNRVADLTGRISLCVCSPPYPGVHVLYHRWQHLGRRETAAPYWVAAAPDGYGAVHYTMGGRSLRGIEEYYRQLVAIFNSLKPLLRDDAHVVQLIAFPKRDDHLPRYLAAMEAAGFVEATSVTYRDERIARQVPNRRWYNRVRAGDASDSSTEVVLVHTPVPRP